MSELSRTDVRDHVADNPLKPVATICLHEEWKYTPYILSKEISASNGIFLERGPHVEVCAKCGVLRIKI